MISQGISLADKQNTQQVLTDSENDLSIRISHAIFMDIIATHPNPQDLQNLDYLNPACEEVIQDCKVEFLKDHMDKKDQSMVSEDKSHAIFQQKYSLKELMEALESITREKDPGLLAYFKGTIEENLKRKEYFQQKGLSDDEAYACALVLSFYSGAKKYGVHTSLRTNRGASLVARTCNLDAQSIQSKKFFPIMQYIMKALAFIPYHWGPCLRYVELKSEEQARYQAGSIVSWVQFTSSTKKATGLNDSYFGPKNTIFHIFSLTGRIIQPFSNYSVEEEEVLFAPWCTFLVTKKEYREDDKKTHIYVRQVELGTTKNTILWVDDHIMGNKIKGKEWENKKLMEILTGQGLEKNLRIIPKTSTKLALAFIDSHFGQYIKQHIAKDDFQIVTDMTREGEENESEAGAILIKELRERGFDHKFTVYVFRFAPAKEALDKHAGHLLQGASNYRIITDCDDFLKFVQTRLPAPNSNPKPNDSDTGIEFC